MAPKLVTDTSKGRGKAKGKVIAAGDLSTLRSLVATLSLDHQVTSSSGAASSSEPGPMTSSGAAMMSSDSVMSSSAASKKSGKWIDKWTEHTQREWALWDAFVLGSRLYNPKAVKKCYTRQEWADWYGWAIEDWILPTEHDEHFDDFEPDDEVQSQKDDDADDDDTDKVQ